MAARKISRSSVKKLATLRARDEGDRTAEFEALLYETSKTKRYQLRRADAGRRYYGLAGWGDPVL